MANNVIKTSFGTFDTSTSPINADQLGDGSTYGLDMTFNGVNYKYVPKDLVQNGGLISSDNAYLFPWLANVDNLNTFTKNASMVDLGDVSFSNWLKSNNVGTEGYLVKADAVPFDSQVKTQPAAELGGTLTGLKNNNGEIVIGLSGGGGSRYLTQSGEVHNPTITYSSILGDIFGGAGASLSDAFNSGLSAINSLGPIGTAAISAASPLAGAAIAGANAGHAVGSGAPLSDVALSAGAAYAGSQLGSSVGADYGQAAGQVAGGTASGLLRGQDLGTALGNSALSAGAYQAAGGLLNSGVNTSGYTGTRDYTTGANYDLTQGQNVGGLGLTATPAPLDMNNPYSFDTTSGNIGAMGGGQGIQIPTEANATLGSIGAETDASTGSPTNNPALQNLLSKLLLTGITGTTGTNNMATTDNNNALLGGLLGNFLTGGAGLMQSGTNQAAYQAQADALRQAGQTAAQQAQFRPVGTTTTFGTSNFAVDPTTGQLTSAGYTLSPQLQAYQDQIMGANRQSLNDAATLQNLGRSYIGQNPQAVAQNWLNQQQALLAPGRDVESARLANQLQQTGRTGVSVAQGGNLGAANPEMQALANARAMQDAQLAANAQQFGQQQVNFGQGLLSSAYQPFTAGLNTAASVEQLGQQPFTMSQGLAKEAAASGANAGRLGLAGNISAADSMLKANQINPASTLLGNLGKSNLFNSAIGNLAGNTSIGSALGSWLSSLNSPDLSWTTGTDVIPTSTATGSWVDSLTPEERQQYGL